MSELDILFGQRDAALFREDMERVKVLEDRIAILAAELRLKLVQDCVWELQVALAQFEEELRGQRRD
jgi:hypothetical protein